MFLSRSYSTHPLFIKEEAQAQKSEMTFPKFQ